MKNKILLTLFFIYLTVSFSKLSYSNESFNFNVTEIEIKNNGNKFIGKNKGIATSSDGTKIQANNFEYNKIQNQLLFWKCKNN